MSKIEPQTIRGADARTAGDYDMYLQISADLLNLAVEHETIDESTVATFINDFQNARNAWEVRQVQSPLTRLLYREAIDYSDILYNNGEINEANYKMLKSNIALGKEFTSSDLDDADRLDTVAVRTSNGSAHPAEAASEILEGLEQMELRRVSRH